MLTPASCLAELDSLGLDAEASALFLGGNAARIFPTVSPSASQVVGPSSGDPT